MSTFHGLEMARRALSVQQAALYTTGHNISNANTKGFSRQRVDFQTSLPYPAVGRNRPQIPGQVGTGVDIGAITRVRNDFLDKQFRAENSRVGFWDAQANALYRMEELLNEPSKTGLSHTMTEFWQSLQDLSVNPESGGARAVVAQRGLAVAETFGHLSETLQTIQNDILEEIDKTADTVNSLLRQISQINDQLKQIEPHGYVANDLYDKRDLLLDELSDIVSIRTTYDSLGANSKEIAQGIVSIELVNRNGSSLNPPIVLLDGMTDYHENYFDDFLTYTDSGDGSITSLQFKDQENITVEQFVDQTMGRLAGLIVSHGYEKDNGEVEGHFPNILNRLNTMAKAFAEEFNRVHRLDGASTQDFFVIADDEDAAFTITVHEDIIRNPNLINANTLLPGQDLADQYNNGENALNLAKVFSTALADLDNLSVEGYFENMIGIIGVEAREANRMTENTNILLQQVDEQRMSISAVSLDEEMANMLKFQHAYNAAARSMTAIDELLDRIINNMGLVGR